MNPFPTLRSKRLVLRKIVASDIAHIYQGLSDPEITKYYAVSFDSLEATQAQMDWFADLEEEGTGIWWAVCAGEDGNFLGAGGLNALSKEHLKAEVGFWLLPPNTGAKAT